MAPPNAKELDRFLTDILNISQPHLLRKTDQRGLLDRLAFGFHAECPFTNLWEGHLRLTLGDQRYKIRGVSIYAAPLLSRVLNGQGGVCTALAHTLNILLKHLGFDSYVGLALTRNRPGMEMLHCVVIIKAVLSSDDLWLIDPGTRIAPLFQAVCLSVVKEKGAFDLGRSSFVQNRFQHDPTHNLYTRHYKPIQSNRWTLFYEFSLDDCTFYDGQVFDWSRVAFKRPAVEYFKLRAKGGGDLSTFWESNFVLSGYPQGLAHLFINNQIKTEDASDSTEDTVSTCGTGTLSDTTADTVEDLRGQLFAAFPRLECEEAEFYISALWKRRKAASSKL